MARQGMQALRFMPQSLADHRRRASVAEPCHTRLADDDVRRRIVRREISRSGPLRGLRRRGRRAIARCVAWPSRRQGDHELALRLVGPRDDLHLPKSLLLADFNCVLDAAKVRCAFRAVDPAMRSSIEKARQGMVQYHTHRRNYLRTPVGRKWGIHPRLRT